jgi:hypothetical protein
MPDTIALDWINMTVSRNCLLQCPETGRGLTVCPAHIQESTGKLPTAQMTQHSEIYNMSAVRTEHLSRSPTLLESARLAA